MKRTTFAFLILFIASVSAYDTFRCVVDAEELYAIELNPMARMLIRGNDVSLLVCGKAFGAGIVVGVLCELRHGGYKFSDAVILSVAAAQLVVVFAYLL